MTSGRYGRYIMTYSGIHFNYSFSEELLKADYEAHQRAYEVGTFRGALSMDSFSLTLISLIVCCPSLQL